MTNTEFPEIRRAVRPIRQLGSDGNDEDPPETFGVLDHQRSIGSVELAEAVSTTLSEHLRWVERRTLAGIYAHQATADNGSTAQIASSATFEQSDRSQPTLGETETRGNRARTTHREPPVQPGADPDSDSDAEVEPTTVDTPTEFTPEAREAFKRAKHPDTDKTDEQLTARSLGVLPVPLSTTASTGRLARLQSTAAGQQTATGHQPDLTYLAAVGPTQSHSAMAATPDSFPTAQSKRATQTSSSEGLSTMAPDTGAVSTERTTTDRSTLAGIGVATVGLSDETSADRDKATDDADQAADSEPTANSETVDDREPADNAKAVDSGAEDADQEVAALPLTAQQTTTKSATHPPNLTPSTPPASQSLTAERSSLLARRARSTTSAVSTQTASATSKLTQHTQAARSMLSEYGRTAGSILGLSALGIVGSSRDAAAETGPSALSVYGQIASDQSNTENLVPPTQPIQPETLGESSPTESILDDGPDGLIHQTHTEYNQVIEGDETADTSASFVGSILGPEDGGVGVGTPGVAVSQFSSWHRSQQADDSSSLLAAATLPAELVSLRESLSTELTSEYNELVGELESLADELPNELTSVTAADVGRMRQELRETFEGFVSELETLVDTRTTEFNQFLTEAKVELESHDRDSSRRTTDDSSQQSSLNSLEAELRRVDDPAREGRLAGLERLLQRGQGQRGTGGLLVALERSLSSESHAASSSRSHWYGEPRREPDRQPSTAATQWIAHPTRGQQSESDSESTGSRERDQRPGWNRWIRESTRGDTPETTRQRAAARRQRREWRPSSRSTARRTPGTAAAAATASRESRRRHRQPDDPASRSQQPTDADNTDADKTDTGNTETDNTPQSIPDQRNSSAVPTGRSSDSEIPTQQPRSRTQTRQPTPDTTAQSPSRPTDSAIQAQQPPSRDRSATTDGATRPDEEPSSPRRRQTEAPTDRSSPSVDERIRQFRRFGAERTARRRQPMGAAPVDSTEPQPVSRLSETERPGVSPQQQSTSRDGRYSSGESGSTADPETDLVNRRPQPTDPPTESHSRDSTEGGQEDGNHRASRTATRQQWQTQQQTRQSSRPTVTTRRRRRQRFTSRVRRRVDPNAPRPNESREGRSQRSETRGTTRLRRPKRRRESQADDEQKPQSSKTWEGLSVSERTGRWEQFAADSRQGRNPAQPRDRDSASTSGRTRSDSRIQTQTGSIDKRSADGTRTTHRSATPTQEPHQPGEQSTGEAWEGLSIAARTKRWEQFAADNRGGLRPPQPRDAGAKTTNGSESAGTQLRVSDRQQSADQQHSTNRQQSADQQHSTNRQHSTDRQQPLDRNQSSTARSAQSTGEPWETLSIADRTKRWEEFAATAAGGSQATQSRTLQATSPSQQSTTTPSQQSTTTSSQRSATTSDPQPTHRHSQQTPSSRSDGSETDSSSTAWEELFIAERTNRWETHTAETSRGLRSPEPRSMGTSQLIAEPHAGRNDKRQSKTTDAGSQPLRSTHQAGESRQVHTQPKSPHSDGTGEAGSASDSQQTDSPLSEWTSSLEGQQSSADQSTHPAPEPQSSIQESAGHTESAPEGSVDESHRRESTRQRSPRDPDQYRLRPDSPDARADQRERQTRNETQQASLSEAELDRLAERLYRTIERKQQLDRQRRGL